MWKGRKKACPSELARGLGGATMWLPQDDGNEEKGLHQKVTNPHHF